MLGPPGRGRWVRVALLAGLLALLPPLWQPWLDAWRPLPLPERQLAVAGATRTFYFYRPAALPAPPPWPLLVFLQGLDTASAPSGHTRQLGRFLMRAADRHGFLLALPRGLPGAFPESPRALAWSPRGHCDNRDFLAILCRHLVASEGADPDRLWLGAFSNGAYFGAIELLGNPASPFAGYWFDGGGDAYPLATGVLRRAVAVGMSSRDIDNYTYVANFVAGLRQHGWREPDELLVQPHAGGHDVDQAGFAAVARFLLARARLSAASAAAIP